MQMDATTGTALYMKALLSSESMRSTFGFLGHGYFPFRFGSLVTTAMIMITTFICITKSTPSFLQPLSQKVFPVITITFDVALRFESPPGRTY